MACGFSSPSAFIETFRTTLGVTPGRYRHEAHAPDGSEVHPRQRPAIGVQGVGEVRGE
jgi:AraC-like DNA-binding protein